MTEGALYEGDDDADDGKGWFTGPLKFKRHIDDDLRKGSDGRNADDYAVIDPLKPGGGGGKGGLGEGRGARGARGFDGEGERAGGRGNADRNRYGTGGTGRDGRGGGASRDGNRYRPSDDKLVERGGR